MNYSGVSAFRNFSRKSTFRWFNTANSWLTSNLEVFTNLPNTKQPTLSEIDIADIKQRKSTVKRGHVNDIKAYFESKECLKELKHEIPATYVLKKSVNPTSKFIVDKDVACDMFQALRPYLETKNGHIMEINAGPGVLTEELLKAQVQNLRIYEPDARFCNKLLELIKYYKSNARLFCTNLLMLGSIIQRDSADNQDRVKSLFDGLPCLKWEDEPVAKVITVLPNYRFILHVMFSIILQSGLCAYGRSELFVVISPDSYDRFVSSPIQNKFYRSQSVIFQVFFDYEILLKVPEKAFIPWRRKPATSKKQMQVNDDKNELYLLKITPKKDLFQHIPPHLMKHFYFFVKSMIQNKSSRVIANMEKWIPGIGVYLITKGYTIFTTCGSLTPDEYVELFLQFSSLPDFDSCSFVNIVENKLAKFLELGAAEELLSENSQALSKLMDVTKDNVDVFNDGENLEHFEKDVNVEEEGS